MFTKSLVVGAAALAACTAATLPADAKPNNEVRETVIFWLLDRNGDGQIDKVEVEALRATIFDAVDADNDGNVSRDEFSDVIGNMVGPRQMREDRRGGPDSRGDRMEQRGDRHDGRRGGDYAERGGPEPRGDRHDGRHGGDDAERGGHGQGHWEKHSDRRGGPKKGEAGERRNERMMDRLGIDATDGLSKNDFVGATPKLFERADDDGNGTVSKSEFEQAKHVGRMIILE